MLWANLTTAQLKAWSSEMMHIGINLQNLAYMCFLSMTNIFRVGSYIYLDLQQQVDYNFLSLVRMQGFKKTINYIRNHKHALSQCIMGIKTLLFLNYQFLFQLE